MAKAKVTDPFAPADTGLPTVDLVSVGDTSPFVHEIVVDDSIMLNQYPRSRSVRVNGEVYEHVSEDADGRWVYRHM